MVPGAQSDYAHKAEECLGACASAPWEDMQQG